MISDRSLARSGWWLCDGAWFATGRAFHAHGRGRCDALSIRGGVRVIHHTGRHESRSAENPSEWHPTHCLRHGAGLAGEGDRGSLGTSAATAAASRNVGPWIGAMRDGRAVSPMWSSVLLSAPASLMKAMLRIWPLQAGQLSGRASSMRVGGIARSWRDTARWRGSLIVDRPGCPTCTALLSFEAYP